VHSTIQTLIILLVGAGMLFCFRIINAPLWMISFFILFPLITAGISVGRRLIPNEHPILRSIWGTVALLAILMILRGIWFYLGLDLNGWGTVIPEAVLFIGVAIFELLMKRGIHGTGFTEQEIKNAEEKISEQSHRQTLYLLFSLFTFFISLLAFLLIAYAAYRAGTDQSIRTPWPLLPFWILPLIGMQWIFAIATLSRMKNRWLAAAQVMLAIASTTVIAPLVYQIGFGFDGFLHVAGEEVLLRTGTLLPHPPYYMGQYLFTTWIARIADIGIAFVDRWLVPVSAAILLPLSLLIHTREKRNIALFAGLVLIPPVAFVTTTPHGFSIVLACVAILLAMGIKQHHVHPSLPILIGLWCAFTHPLVGLPILGATVASAVYEPRHRIRTMLSILIALGGSLAVPVMFGLAAFLGSSGGVNFQLSNLFTGEKWAALISNWIPWVHNRYALWAESSVWIEKLLPWIISLLAIGERIRLAVKKESTPPWLTAAITASLSALILTIAGDFGFLIDYERGNYADRLWLVAWILLLPLAIASFARFIERIRTGSFASLVGVLAGIGILAAGMSYAALPRHDAVTPSRGWSVGRADIEAVKLIEEDSNGEPYTVLANQSVSAAAVRTFGFKRYNGDVFFYPIPTGGSLYELFLKASYENPSAKIMTEAGALGGSHLVYFVVNDYWWKSDELIELAKKDAVRTFEIQGGNVMVFKYEVGTRH
jgi:hypothetical protein